LKIVRLFRRLGIAAALLLVMLATACIPLPADPNWGHLSLAGDPQQILFAFHDRIVLINPIDGSVSQLRDPEGNPRYDDQNNPRQWSVQVTGGEQTRFYSTPLAGADNTLIAASYDKRLFEIDFPNARVISSDGIPVGGHIVTDPISDGERLYVGLSEGDLIALDMTDLASRVWTLETQRGVWSEPLLADGRLYVSSMDHNLYAIDAETGSEIWRLDLGGALSESPVLYEGNLYVGSFARKLFRISLDGQITAEYPTTEWIWGTPAIVDDTLYVGDAAGWVYALALSEDGFTPVWSRQVATRVIRATPIVTEDSVIVASRDHKIYWVSRNTGAAVFERNTDAEILANMLVIDSEDNPSLSEPLLIVSTMANDKLLFAYTLDQGDLRWRYAR